MTRRSGGRFAAFALLAALVLAGCGPGDTLLRRKFELLNQENARLLGAMAEVDEAQAVARIYGPRASEAAVQALTQENDRLRKILLEHQHAAASASNAALRTPIEKATQEIRELKLKKPVDYEVLNRTEIRAVMEKKLAETYSADDFHHISGALAAIGLLPAGYDLRDKYLSLLSEQVAAFYDQHTHKLFMYEDATLENTQNRVVLAHELTHALQDQHFNLLKMPLELKDNDDRAAAASALIEGDATMVMTAYTMRNLSLRAIRESVSSTLGQNLQQLAAAPRYLREMLIFPYLRGQAFCQAVAGAGGGYAALSRVYAHPPTSTAQILHPELYLAEPREEPVALHFSKPLLHGKPPLLLNTLGEFGVRILFTESLDSARAERVGEGWRGDRYAFFAEGDALLWKSVWRSDEDAAEFLEAERDTLAKRHSIAWTPADDGSYTTDAPRAIRLWQTPQHEVMVIDAATPPAAAALEKLAGRAPAAALSQLP